VLRQELTAANRTSQRTLVVGAGEGTTGTRSLAAGLRMLGMRVLHWSDPGLMELLAQTEPENYVDLDFVQLLYKYDAVLDLPIAQFFPYILAAFPMARVIHTVRDPLEWTIRRASAERHHFTNSNMTDSGDPKPLVALHAKLDAIAPPNVTWKTDPWNWAKYGRFDEKLGLRTLANRSRYFANAIAYSAQNVYYRCITPPEQYMLLNVLGGDLCAPYFVSRLLAFTRWHRVQPNAARLQRNVESQLCHAQSLSRHP